MPRVTVSRFLHLAAATLAVVALAGCGVDRAAAPDLPLAGDGSVEWQGVSACADCDAIETRLRLVRAGDDASYRLDERFVAADGGESFSEEGRWTLREGVVDLDGSGGARRHYAVLADGRLRIADADGDPLPGAGDGELLPVAAETF